MVRASDLLLLFMLFTVRVWAEEIELPSLELLEFLAEGLEIDGQLLDPISINEQTMAGVRFEKESQGNE